VGVTLFFVLSGFLITGLLVDEQSGQGTIRLGAFYGRRALRLLPALFVYLAGVAAIAWLMRLALPISDMTWPPALYVANYVQIFGSDLHANTHTWSLAVEEHFYIVWPLLVVAGATRRVKPVVLTVLGLLCWRIAIGVLAPTWALIGSDTNAYALGFGCLIAIVSRRESLPLSPRWSVPAALAVLLMLSLLPTTGAIEQFYPTAWLPPMAALAGGIAIVGVIQHDPVPLRSRVLGWFGMISYALYLWHLPLMRLPGLSETPIRRLIAVALAIGVALCSWVLVERPILESRWRKAMTSGRASGGGVLAGNQAP
jgi:peptidoglycan/LPS O-acetylase OafA/YrhL